jgi:hypothetical protein
VVYLWIFHLESLKKIIRILCQGSQSVVWVSCGRPSTIGDWPDVTSPFHSFSHFVTSSWSFHFSFYLRDRLTWFTEAFIVIVLHLL